MADLNYRFTGVNKAQLGNEVRLLRQNSSTFRALEAAAGPAGYRTIEIQMGAGLLPGDIANSIKTDSFTRTIRINSDATGNWGAGRRLRRRIIEHLMIVSETGARPRRVSPGCLRPIIRLHSAIVLKNWGSSPAVGSISPRSPVLRALEKYRGSPVLDGPASTSRTTPLDPGQPLPTADGKPERMLSRNTVGEPQAPITDTGAPAASLAPPDDSNFSGGLLGRLVALAGIDPQNPTQPAPPPLDGQLCGFYRDGSLQPWLLWRQH